MDDDIVSAYHESGHVVIGSMIGVQCRSATIHHPAHVTLSLHGIFKIAFDDNARAIFFLSGMVTQQHYFPSVEITSKNDQAVLWGLPDYRRNYYENYILRHLDDPTVRRDIETLAERLLTDISITF